MSLRPFDIRVPALRLCAAALLFAATLPAEDQAPGAPPQTPPSQPAPASPTQTAPAQTAHASSGKKPAVPDYPDPRTISVGVFYWLTIPGSGPDLIGGKAATGYETLDHLGKEHSAPGVEVIVPITRTGELHFEGFLAKGTGSQDAPVATTLYSTSYNKGDYLSTQYQITSAKVYLDDLLFPYKFPVSKFRLKSLWELQYVLIKGTVDAPLKPTTDSAGNLIDTTGTGNNSILFPTFGIAAEYAIAPHVLLRADASGFGLPGRAEIYDANGIVAWRREKWEFRAGVKFLHFKTSPQRDEYLTDTLSGGFIGVRYHWQ